ncbi:MAG: glycosyltransferase [Solibacillus sp.]
MKILILCDHYPVSPRVIKVKESLVKQFSNASVKIVAWNRGELNSNDPEIITVNRPIGYGNQKGKLLYLYEFYKKAKGIVKKENPDIVHAIDFEMFLLGSKLAANKQLVYEVYDIKFFTNKKLNLIREKLEFYLLAKYKPDLILASPFFAEYYKGYLNFENFKSIVINNKPKYINNSDRKENLIVHRNTKKALEDAVVIGFIGTVRYKELLINLINAVEKSNNIKVLIAGDGPDKEALRAYVLEQRLEEKVIFIGRYTMNEIREIYEMCDYIWAAYPSEDLNVKYAVSNKFFESRVYKKKVIVSENTMLGDFAVKEGIGIALNPYSVESIIFELDKFGKMGNQNIDSIENSLMGGLYWEEEEMKLNEIYNLTSK